METVFFIVFSGVVLTAISVIAICFAALILRVTIDLWRE